MQTNQTVDAHRNFAIKSLNVIAFATYHPLKEGPASSRTRWRETAFNLMKRSAATIARDLQLIPKPKPDQRENFEAMFDALSTSVEGWCKAEPDAQRAQVFQSAYEDARGAWMRLVTDLRRLG